MGLIFLGFGGFGSQVRLQGNMPDIANSGAKDGALSLKMATVLLGPTVSKSVRST